MRKPSYVDQPCSRCGSKKRISRTWKEKIATLTTKQVEEIAKQKMEDVNTIDIKQAMKIVKGTARSMGIEVID